MTTERKNEIIKDIISKMDKLGYEVYESGDCIEFMHIDGEHLEFDTWKDVCDFLIDHGVE